MEFYQYCKAAVAGDHVMAEILDRLPASGFTFDTARRHLREQRAPGWCKTALTFAHENFLDEQEADKTAEDEREAREARAKLTAVE